MSQRADGGIASPNMNPGARDDAIARSVSTLLRMGVIAAAIVGAIGGVVYAATIGNAPISYARFTGGSAQLRSVSGILSGSLRLDGAAIIQLGILMLIATPVARVVFTLYEFIRERDIRFVVVTLIVLTVLTLGLLGIVGN